MGISLVHEQSERLRPPRTLWVPFEFGRPLGVPNDTAFQRAVVRAALALLERPSGPVLEDYPVEVPRSDDGADGWACPVALPPPDPGETEAEQLVLRVLDEVARLRPWFGEARRQHGRTTFGVSGIDAGSIEAVVDTLARFATGEHVSPPDGAILAFPRLFRYLADDAKSFYTEAATAQPTSAAPSGEEFARWLYTETALGDVLFRVRARLAASEDPAEQRAQGGIVPGVFIRLRREADAP